MSAQRKSSSPYLSSIRKSGCEIGNSIARKSYLLQQEVKRISASNSRGISKVNPINVKPTKSQRLKNKNPNKPAITNIESIHAEKMKYYHSLQKNVLPKKKEELKKLKNKLERKKSDSIDTDTDIQRLITDIEKIESREEENDYLLKTAHILNEYTEILKDEKDIVNKGETSDVEVDTSSSSWNQRIGSTQERKRRIINEYLKCVDMEMESPILPFSIAVSKPLPSPASTSSGASTASSSSCCENCGKNIDDFSITDEGFLTCMNCGLSKSYFSGELVSFKEMQTYDFTRRFDYERPNHFAERLAQSQSKENVEIPENIMDMIKAELKKERITDMTKLTRGIMKNILKKIKLSKYYEHIPLIISKLDGVPALKFPPELEEQFITMFKELQEPFERHKPKGRRNCISYPYILYKFCELLEYDEFLPSFQLLKDREKLYNTDQVWKKICKDLEWEYIPTV